jgi:hypothetical protein
MYTLYYTVLKVLLIISIVESIVPLINENDYYLVVTNYKIKIKFKEIKI